MLASKNGGNFASIFLPGPGRCDGMLLLSGWSSGTETGTRPTVMPLLGWKQFCVNSIVFVQPWFTSLLSPSWAHKFTFTISYVLAHKFTFTISYLLAQKFTYTFYLQSGPVQDKSLSQKLTIGDLWNLKDNGDAWGKWRNRKSNQNSLIPNRMKNDVKRWTKTWAGSFSQRRIRFAWLLTEFLQSEESTSKHSCGFWLAGICFTNAKLWNQLLSIQARQIISSKHKTEYIWVCSELYLLTCTPSNSSTQTILKEGCPISRDG